MPRYYFNICKGDLRTDDNEGTEIPDIASIHEEAIEAARDLLAEGDIQGLDRRQWAFEVTDETGTIVLTLAFQDAVEPDLPPKAS